MRKALFREASDTVEGAAPGLLEDLERGLVYRPIFEVLESIASRFSPSECYGEFRHVVIGRDIQGVGDRSWVIRGEGGERGGLTGRSRYPRLVFEGSDLEGWNVAD